MNRSTSNEGCNSLCVAVVDTGAMLKLDLTTAYPRSVKEKLFGVVHLPRAIDKGIADAAGTPGEYMYHCPMDKRVLGFLGIDADVLLNVIRNAQSRSEIEAYAKPFVDKKPATEIEDFNRQFLASAPEPGSEGEAYFLELRNAAAPNRTDVTTWADLLDLDEKRDVPQRVAV